MSQAYVTSSQFPKTQTAGVPASSDGAGPSSPRRQQVEPDAIELPHQAPDTPTELPPPPSTNPRLAALATKKAKLESTLAHLRAQRAALVAQAKLSSGLAMPAEWSEEQQIQHALATANAVIKEHIARLHRYNEIKDIGQGLLGLIADTQGVRVARVMEDFGMSDKD